MRYCSGPNKDEIKTKEDKLWMARSRLYQQIQHRFLRPNIHFAAFFEIYKIRTPLHRSELKKLKKNRQSFHHKKRFLLFFKNFIAFSIKFNEILSKFQGTS